MEKRGIQTNIGNLNREIRAANRLMKSIRQLIQNLKGWITELEKNGKSCLHKRRRRKRPLLPNLLMKYHGDTKGRTEGLDEGWTEPGTVTGLQRQSAKPCPILRQKGLSTVERLEAFLEYFRGISRRLPQSDEAKGSPQQSD